MQKLLPKCKNCSPNAKTAPCNIYAECYCSRRMTITLGIQSAFFLCEKSVFIFTASSEYHEEI